MINSRSGDWSQVPKPCLDRVGPRINGAFLWKSVRISLDDCGSKSNVWLQLTFSFKYNCKRSLFLFIFFYFIKQRWLSRVLGNKTCDWIRVLTKRRSNRRVQYAFRVRPQTMVYWNDWSSNYQVVHTLEKGSLEGTFTENIYICQVNKNQNEFSHAC